MKAGRGRFRIRSGWSAVILLTVIAAIFAFTAASFGGVFQSYLPVTLTSDRTGLVMESGAKVKMRGVQVGRVAGIQTSGTGVVLALEIQPEQVRYIPANVQAEIQATTLFAAKFVNLIYPNDASPQRISRGAVLRSRNVTTEVNTVFENLVGVLRQIDPAKLNAVLTAVAEAVRGRGPQLGQAISDTDQVLVALNARSDTITQDLRSLQGFSETYAGAAQDIVAILDAASTTSTTVTGQAAQLNTLLLNAIGFAQSGIALLGPNEANLVNAINTLRPTTDLLYEYNPEYTCVLLGAQWFLDHNRIGANGRTGIIDAGVGLGDDPYLYPTNLPIVAAKGGPGGKPGCGSLPDASKNYPVRYLVTDTGWGTGLDVRPNPGIGHPWWIDYLPVTRAIPEPPSVRGAGPPAVGPMTAPGEPPYGAPLYAPDGTPLYPVLPAQPAAPAP